MTYKDIIAIMWLIPVSLLIFYSSTHAASPREQLKQYVDDLQKNPDDYALREKIIQLVNTMEPKPAISEEARQHLVGAGTYVESAKTLRAYELAVEEYEKALLVAPWWSNAYYDYSVALESLCRFDDAVKALNLYLMTKPDEKEARNAKDRIYKMRAKKKLAQEEKQEREAQEKKGPRETKRDGRFIAYNDGTVLDTRTNLMWAAKDSEREMNWFDANQYCENYRGGGYTDWRLPTYDELVRLYDSGKSHRASQAKMDVHLTNLIQLSHCCAWSSDRIDYDRAWGTAAYFSFAAGPLRAPLPGFAKQNTYFVLPVRYAR